MASGKEKENGADDGNPFSFHYFVKKKTTKSMSKGDVDSESSDDERSNDLQKVSGESNSSQKNDDQGLDNPYSFRKFLVKDAPTSSASPRPTRHVNHNNDVFDSVPDIASDLPDFVQDRVPHDFPRRGSNGGRIRSASDVSLPDFVMGTSDAPSTAESSYSSVFPSINAIGSLIGRDGRDEGPMYGKSRPASSGAKMDRRVPVPSFLEVDEDLKLCKSRDDLVAENRKLNEENTVLKRQLHETRDLAWHESERCAQLVKKVKSLQNHEAYETAALERMVQQVEANLEATTERALKAESIISKQKQDIKQLREQLAALQMTNGGCEPMDEIRDRTQYMSRELAATAANAEVTLKQMLSGVQNLKLMSDILLSIGKIYDDTDEGKKQEKLKEKELSDDSKTSVKNSSDSNESHKDSSYRINKSDKTKSKDTQGDDVRLKTKMDNGVKKKPVNKAQTGSEKLKK